VGRMRKIVATAGAAAVMALTPPVAGCGADERIVRSDYHVTSDPGMQIAVREVSSDSADPAKRSVLLLHGARVPGVASFDLAVAGGSLAADQAYAGHRVFVMDARGYGGSTRPSALSEPPEANPPQVRSDVVVRDVAAVVDHIAERAREEHPDGKVALLGWATGAHWLGQFAATHPDRVSHLMLYNALYGPIDGHPTMGRGSDYEDPNGPGRFNAGEFGAYRLVAGPSLLPSWDQRIPTDDKSIWRDPAVVDAYVRAALASDPTSGTRSPPSFRAPSGAIEDSFYLATGRQLWDAASISAPTLVLRSEHDFWSRPEDARLLERHLTRARTVRTVELDNATHYVHLDRPQYGRDQFLAEIARFLAET
jgi:pimeloyl-ACP methyl ester carboxylesterase